MLYLFSFNKVIFSGLADLLLSLLVKFLKLYQRQLNHKKCFQNTFLIEVLALVITDWIKLKPRIKCQFKICIIENCMRCVWKVNPVLKYGPYIPAVVARRTQAEIPASFGQPHTPLQKPLSVCLQVFKIRVPTLINECPADFKL